MYAIMRRFNNFAPLASRPKLMECQHPTFQLPTFLCLASFIYIQPIYPSLVLRISCVAQETFDSCSHLMHVASCIHTTYQKNSTAFGSTSFRLTAFE